MDTSLRAGCSASSGRAQGDPVITGWGAAAGRRQHGRARSHGGARVERNGQKRKAGDHQFPRVGPARSSGKGIVSAPPRSVSSTAKRRRGLLNAILGEALAVASIGSWARATAFGGTTAAYGPYFADFVCLLAQAHRRSRRPYAMIVGREGERRRARRVASSRGISRVAIPGLIIGGLPIIIERIRAALGEP